MLGVVTRVSNDPRAVRMLICLGANVNTSFTRGRDGNCNMSSPLIAATVGPVGPDRMVRVMRMLLDAGADVNGRCEMVGTLNGTALLAAAFLGEPDAVRVLLERPEVDLHATGVGFRNGAPFASYVISRFDENVPSPWFSYLPRERGDTCAARKRNVCRPCGAEAR